MRLLVLFHRWVGVVLCLMFATWFATGAMMVFVAFPSLGAGDAAKASAPIRLRAVTIGPDAARAALGNPADLRLVDRDGTPAYVAVVAGHAAALSALDGARMAAKEVNAANGFMAERFLFATAYPLVAFKDAIDAFIKFPLKESVLERIFYKNAAELLGIV